MKSSIPKSSTVDYYALVVAWCMIFALGIGSLIIGVATIIAIFMVSGDLLFYHADVYWLFVGITNVSLLGSCALMGFYLDRMCEGNLTINCILFAIGTIAMLVVGLRFLDEDLGWIEYIPHVSVWIGVLLGAITSHRA